MYVSFFEQPNAINNTSISIVSAKINVGSAGLKFSFYSYAAQIKNT